MFPIADGHCDYLYKLYRSQLFHLQDVFQASPEKLQQGGVRLQVFALYLPPSLRYDFSPLADMMGYFLKKVAPYFPLLSERNWRQWDPKSQRGAILALEGADPLLGQEERLLALLAWGVRLITLTWNLRNDLADGVFVNQPGYGLTTKGKKFLTWMEKNKVALDVSHLSEVGFWEVMENFSGAVAATHSNAYRLCPHPRNLKDDQIRALAAKKGVLGINFCPSFLTTKPKASLEDVMAHICYICDLLGNCYSVAFGSDFDGISDLPLGISDSSEWPKLAELLSRHFCEADVEKILFGNWYRFWSDLFQNGT